jgi:hypothetical protein
MEATDDPLQDDAVAIVLAPTSDRGRAARRGPEPVGSAVAEGFLTAAGPSSQRGLQREHPR